MSLCSLTLARLVSKHLKRFLITSMTTNEESKLNYYINAPTNVKPYPPPPGHRWGFVQLVVQRTHPMGN